MATISGLDDLTAIVTRLEGGLAKVNREVGRHIGEMGKDEVRAELTKIFGSDLRLSGSARSRKGRRQATVRSNVSSGGEHVTITPGGDPVYINLIRGRGGGKTIRPRRRGGRALKLPGGQFRSTSRVGRLAPQPERLDPAVRRVADRAGEEMSRAVSAALARL